MVIWLPIILAIILIFVAIHLYCRKWVAQFRTNPSLYQIDFLLGEPDGIESYVETDDGARLRCVTEGEGQDVILAHGYGMTLVVWNSIWRQLIEHGFRVIAFDHRGHGKTELKNGKKITADQMASDFVAVAKHFEVNNGILVAHSMSGFLSIKALLKHPELAQTHLDGLVLISSVAGEGLRGAPQNRLQVPLLKWGILRLLSYVPTYRYLFGASVFGIYPTASEIEAFNTIFFEHRHRPTMKVLQAICHESHYTELNQINLPCIVVAGTMDRTTPFSHSIDLSQKIPNARLSKIEGMGHMLIWEAPDDLIDLILSL